MERLQLPLLVLECLMEWLARCGAAAGTVALEEQDEDCFALSQVQRCGRRLGLQVRGLGCARGAAAARHAMWRARALAVERRVAAVLDQVDDIDEDRPLLHRVRRPFFFIYVGWTKSSLCGSWGAARACFVGP